MRIQFAKSVSIFLIALLPSTFLLADTKGAMLYATGAVVLNGMAVRNTVSVFDGDRIDTANNAVGTINQTGSMVSVEPNSAVTYRNNSIDLLRGTARVSTEHGMTVRVDRYSVTPKEATAKFTVARLDNKIFITSNEGSLVLGGAAKTAVLSPGMAATLDSGPTPAPAPAPAPQAAPTFPGYLLSSKQVFIIGAVVAGAAIACGLLCGTSASSVPPVTPIQP